MADLAPTPPEAAPVVPTVVVNAAPANVTVSPSQVWSAAAQNIAIATLVSVGYFLGKCSMEVWILVLTYLTGVDLYGRKLANNGNAGVGSALGATGGLVSAGKTLLAVALVMAVGCGAAGDLLPATGRALLEAQHAQASVVQARITAEKLQDLLCAPPAPAPTELCTELAEDISKAHQATDYAADMIDTAAAIYTELNEAAK